MLDYSELSNWNEYLKLFIAIFAFVSPPIILPLFMGVVGHRTEREQRQTALVASIGFAIIMLAFTFTGLAILNLFGITIAAFRVAAGLLLLLVALDMLRNEFKEDNIAEEDTTTSPFSLGIVPIAMPILAGPGAFSTAIVFASLHDNFSHLIVMGIVMVFLAIYIFLAFLFAIKSGRLFTKTTMVIFFRIMGLIIAAIAIEFILDGIAGHFPSLGSIHD